jgi:hypothetical protein
MKSSRLIWVRYVALMRVTRNAHWILTGQPESKRPLAKPAVHRRIVLKRISSNRVGGVNWIHPAQDRDQWPALVYIIMNLVGT